jgi:hypothetical protein
MVAAVSALLVAQPTRPHRNHPGYGRRVNLHVVADEPERPGPTHDAAAVAPRTDRAQEAADLAEVVRRVARGDAEAFAHLYDATSV